MGKRALSPRSKQHSADRRKKLKRLKTSRKKQKLPKQKRHLEVSVNVPDELQRVKLQELSVNALDGLRRVRTKGAKFQFLLFRLVVL